MLSSTSASTSLSESTKSAYKVGYTSFSNSNVDPGLYFDADSAMEVAKDCLPGLVGVLE